MGNHRFRFSDMMPNAWFHKLKVMARASRSPATTKSAHSARPAPGGPSTSKLLPPPHPAEPPYLQPRRASYYFSSRQQKASSAHPRASDTLFPVDPPRKSKKRARRKQPRPSHRLVSSVSAGGGWSCRATLDSDVRAAEALDGPARVKLEVHRGGEDGDGVPCFDKLIIAECYDGVAASLPPSCNWNGVSSTHDVHDVVAMDVASKFEELDLPPIITKPSEKEPEKPSKLGTGGGRNASSKAATNKNSHKQKSLSPIPAIPKVTQKLGSRFQRRPPPPTPPATPGIRMRAASPRLASKTKVRAQRISRKAAAATPPRGCLYSESFAVVKSSADPQRDFRESMMEMIAENNIRRSRDLEDLLACYLSLNSDQYHDVIVKVFEQIWFDLTDVSCRESCP